MNIRKWWLALSLLLAAASLALFFALVSAQPLASVSGVVQDVEGEPLAGATVRVRATDNVTYSAQDGSFSLQGLEEGLKVEVTAWVDGYYIANAYVTPTVSGVSLNLRPYHNVDNPDYAWHLPEVCAACHPMILPQWTANAHGGAVSNPRFFSLYNGTNITGTMVISPGYQLDFPGTAGVCATCHAPGAGVDGFASTNMNDVRDDLSAGIQCDFCHKIGGVYIDPASGSVYPNAPGVLSLRVLRPPTGDDIFFGPYDDIKDPDTYLPEMAQSRYCAPCHQFSFWGTPIYESYNEWLASPYAQEGITCQACHMPPNGDNYFALPEQGGLWHPAERIPSHNDLGLKDTAFMTNTVSMTVSTQMIDDTLVVQVTLTNTAAGHHVPTDHPGRHMILTVEALDQDGQPLVLVDGETVPAWGGAQVGLPGKTFAKVLMDAQSGDYPVVSYWKQTFILSDNRLPARQSDTSSYRFSVPQGEAQVSLHVTLRFRRNFQSELYARGWNTPDILMRHMQVEIPYQPTYREFLPLVIVASPIK